MNLDGEIQKIQELNRKLTSLLDDPQPGISTWVTFVGKRIEEMNAIVNPSAVEPSLMERANYLQKMRRLETELANAKAALESAGVVIAELLEKVR